MAVSINEICENTKLAREMALTGNYDTSGVYYQGVVQQIQRLLASIADVTRKAKWQTLQQQIVQEFEQVKATSNTLQLFKVDTHTERFLGTIFIVFYGYLPIFTLATCLSRNSVFILRRTYPRPDNVVVRAFYAMGSTTQRSRCLASVVTGRTKVHDNFESIFCVVDFP